MWLFARDSRPAQHLASRPSFAVTVMVHSTCICLHPVSGGSFRHVDSPTSLCPCPRISLRTHYRSLSPRCPVASSPRQPGMYPRPRICVPCPLAFAFTLTYKATNSRASTLLRSCPRALLRPRPHGCVSAPMAIPSRLRSQRRDHGSWFLRYIAVEWSESPAQ